MPSTDCLRTLLPSLIHPISRNHHGSKRKKRETPLPTKRPMSDVTTEPPLSPEERSIVKGYGGWTAFMQSFLLKPWENDDVEEAKAILKGLAVGE